MYQDENEIYHHGILGMHWGIRRYQNADGSLTPAGRKRAAKLKGQYEKLTRKKIKNGEEKFLRRSDSVRSRKNSDLSDIDLDYKINRFKKEKEARSLEKELAETKGKKALSTVFNQVVKPVLIDKAKEKLSNWLKDQQPLDKYEEAKREAEYQKNLFFTEQNKYNRENKNFGQGKNSNNNNNNQYKDLHNRIDKLDNKLDSLIKKGINNITTSAKNAGKNFVDGIKTDMQNAGKRVVNNINSKIDAKVSNVKFAASNFKEGWSNPNKYSLDRQFKVADSILTSPTVLRQTMNSMPDWLIKGNLY